MSHSQQFLIDLKQCRETGFSDRTFLRELLCELRTKLGVNACELNDTMELTCSEDSVAAFMGHDVCDIYLQADAQSQEAHVTIKAKQSVDQLSAMFYLSSRLNAQSAFKRAL